MTPSSLALTPPMGWNSWNTLGHAIGDCRAVARVWKHAQLIETEGLGHRGGLQSKSIHE